MIPTGHGLSKPISGAQNRFSNLLKELKFRNNNITVLCSKNNYEISDEEIAKIYTYTEYTFFGKTLIILRDLNVNFIHNLIRVIKEEKPSVIQITYSSGILATILLVQILRKKIIVVYDAYDVQSEVAKNIFDENHSLFERWIAYWYISFLEKLVCKYADYIISVSSRDKKFFTEKYKVDKQKVIVIPSGSCLFDINLGLREQMKNRYGIDSNKIIVFFHGIYSHIPNREAIEIIINYIAPKFEQTNKDVLFLLAGNKLPVFENKNVKSIGFVEDLHSLLSIVDIAIVPLIHGEGTKLKVFDYMMAGLPIITTNKGAEGIEIENGKHALITNSPDERFIEAIEYLLIHKDEKMKLAKFAKEFAEDRYEWGKIGYKLNEFYADIIN